MTATIIQLRDFQNPKDLERLYAETTLEQQAIEITNIALIGNPHENAIYESSSGYIAPEKDPA